MNVVRLLSYVSALCVTAGVLSAMAIAAQAPGSPLSRFSPEQRKQLISGEVVFEYVINEHDEDDLGHGVAYAIIHRPARVCYDQMVKFNLKYQYFPRLKKTEIIKSDGNRVWVHEILDFKIAELEYVSLMIKDDANMRVDYSLDPEYPHDLEDFSGHYYFEEVDEDSALITYAVSSVDVGLPVPGFIMKALSSRDLPGVVENVKKRFESDGKWTKS